ncbi:MAG TPA: hypothetical protein GX517_13745 [Alicyclobacillus sp.]|nr:hypothetical protein [Alicyclobacillus sp.]
MNKPNKSEQRRIDTLHRELQRKLHTARVLEIELITMGRDYDPYVNTIREVQEHLRKAAETIKPIVVKEG